ncbi:MAG: hypothetical protein QXT30_03635 [Candidatus Bathyarchaeia archaeon]
MGAERVRVADSQRAGAAMAIKRLISSAALRHARFIPLSSNQG